MSKKSRNDFTSQTCIGRNLIVVEEEKHSCSSHPSKSAPAVPHWAFLGFCTAGREDSVQPNHPSSSGGNGNNYAAKQMQVPHSRPKISCVKYWWSQLLWSIFCHLPVSLMWHQEESGHEELANSGCQTFLPLHLVENVSVWTVAHKLGVGLQEYCGQKNFKLLFSWSLVFQSWTALSQRPVIHVVMGHPDGQLCWYFIWEGALMRFFFSKAFSQSLKILRILNISTPLSNQAGSMGWKLLLRQIGNSASFSVPSFPLSTC